MTDKSPRKILVDIVDVQHDFVMPAPAGALPVPGADGIIPAFNGFLRALDPARVAAILFKADTHFPDEYRQSAEKEHFPDHCFWNTSGQRIVLDTAGIDPGIAVGYMNKNEFSMWQHNRLDGSKVAFASAAEQAAYDNLFKVTAAFNDLTPGTPRDEWLNRLGKPEEVDVVMGGFASDFCVNWAIDGYLKRGHRVILLADLTAGIGGDVSPAKSADIRDVAARIYPEALRRGQLQISTSKHWLQ